MTQIKGWTTLRCHHRLDKTTLREVKLLAKPAPQTDPRIDDAMNTVLEKERRSRERIEQCEREAAALLDRAQRRAREVSERTDKRITALRQRCEETTQGTVTRLLGEVKERSRETPVREDEPSRIEEAVRRLAAKLTGGGGKDTDGPAPP
jgi:hypothetical protein